MNQIKDVLSGAAVFLSHRWRLIGNVLDFLQPQKAYRLCVTIKQIDPALEDKVYEGKQDAKAKYVTNSSFVSMHYRLYIQLLLLH